MPQSSSSYGNGQDPEARLEDFVQQLSRPLGPPPVYDSESAWVGRLLGDLFEALGVNVVLVSPQDAAHSKRLADLLGVPYRFLVDEANRLAAQFGISVRNGVPLGLPGGHGPDTVMPTVVAVNAGGTIVYVDQTENYRVRPEPDLYLAILRRAGAIAR